MINRGQWAHHIKDACEGTRPEDRREASRGLSAGRRCGVGEGLPIGCRSSKRRRAVGATVAHFARFSKQKPRRRPRREAWTACVPSSRALVGGPAGSPPRWSLVPVSYAQDWICTDRRGLVSLPLSEGEPRRSLPGHGYRCCGGMWTRRRRCAHGDGKVGKEQFIGPFAGRVSPPAIGRVGRRAKAGRCGGEAEVLEDLPDLPAGRQVTAGRLSAACLSRLRRRQVSTQAGSSTAMTFLVQPHWGQRSGSTSET